MKSREPEIEIGCILVWLLGQSEIVHLDGDEDKDDDDYEDDDDDDNVDDGHIGDDVDDDGGEQWYGVLVWRDGKIRVR